MARDPLRNDRIVDLLVVQNDELSQGKDLPLGEDCDFVDPVGQRPGEVDPVAGKVRGTQEYDTTKQGR